MFKYSDIKDELDQLVKLDKETIKAIRKETKNKNSIYGWKTVCESFNNNDRFKLVLKLVKALYTLPYSNSSIERSFSQLKIIKNNRRLKLSDKNVSSIMILNNLTKKRKVRDFDVLLSSNVLKKVKLALDNFDQLNKELNSKKENRKIKINLKSFIKY